MDMQFSPEDIAFQQEVRRFLAEKLPPRIREKEKVGVALSREEYVQWHRILNERGWVAPTWPKEYGGPGWTVTQRFIFDEELGEAYAPRPLPYGLQMCAPMLIHYGTPEQKAFYLPRILRADDLWCQGYSEPGAGSDLAGLQTRAERQGDRYIVNGTKIWTSYAHYANRCFCLVRTAKSEKKQDGVSVLLIDLEQPGVTIRPIISLDGLRYLNQVFFDNVEVPASDLVGAEGDGWKIAKYILGHERVGAASFARARKLMARLKHAASEEGGADRLAADPAFAAKIAAAEVQLRALEMTGLKMLATLSADKEVGAEANLLKARGTEVEQQISELLSEAIGYYGQPYDAHVLKEGWNEPPIGPDYAATVNPFYFFWRKASISGGSNEIQRNIIAKRELGL